MTTKNALKILDEFTKRKLDLKAGFLDKNKSWNQGNDCITKLSKTMADVM